MVLLVGEAEGQNRGIETKAISGVGEADLPVLYSGMMYVSFGMNVGLFWNEYCMKSRSLLE